VGGERLRLSDDGTGQRPMGSRRAGDPSQRRSALPGACSVGGTRPGIRHKTSRRVQVCIVAASKAASRHLPQLNHGSLSATVPIIRENVKSTRRRRWIELIDVT